MGYVAETAFHLVPVSILLIALPLAVRHVSRETALWSCVMLVSLVEPLFQLLLPVDVRLQARVLRAVAHHLGLLRLQVPF